MNNSLSIPTFFRWIESEIVQITAPVYSDLGQKNRKHEGRSRRGLCVRVCASHDSAQTEEGGHAIQSNILPSWLQSLREFFTRTFGRQELTGSMTANTRGYLGHLGELFGSGARKPYQDRFRLSGSGFWHRCFNRTLRN